MFVILLSSVALALEDPVKEDSERNQKLGLLDYGFTAIFAIECLLKMLDLGMFLHPGAYLRDIWNVMDISVVSCAILSFYFKWVQITRNIKRNKIVWWKFYHFCAAARRVTNIFETENWVWPTEELHLKVSKEIWMLTLKYKKSPLI